MKRLSILTAFSFLLVLAACKKETSASADSLAGTWNFISMSASTNVTYNYTDFGTQYKDISISNYTSSNGSGSVTFSGDNVTSKNIGYSVSTTVFEQSYEDNVLVDTFSMPFNFSVQPTSSTTTYKIIGSDSLWFPGGNIVSSQSLPNGSAPAVASGYRFNISNDTLTLSSIYAKDTVQDLGGVSSLVSQYANYTVKLKRQ
jgi:hypothetical protein